MVQHRAWSIDRRKHSMGEDVESLNILVEQWCPSEWPCPGVNPQEQEVGHSSYILCLKFRKMSMDSEATQNLSQ